MRVPPPSGRAQEAPYRSAPARPVPSYNAAGSSAQPGKPALNIPGLQKGFGGVKVVSSQAHSGRTVSLFKVGDRVIHRTMGKGTVVELIGAGEDQRVRVDFGERGTKLFAANAAPIVKIGE